MKPLLVVVGETASGKSDLAMKLAKDFNGEIISADSWQVYRGFDIGTAKPGSAEQAAVQHHLIDIVDAPDGFSAAVFKGLALKAIEDINNRGKLPILVGGTGLYIDSVLYDYGFLPKPSEELRKTLNELTIPELLGKAEQLNLDLSTIDTRNKRRIIRLIENNGQNPTKGPLRQDAIIIGIQPPREELEQRITERADRMLQAGLGAEVKILSDKYGWEAEPMKGVGYREFKDQFTSNQTPEMTRQRIISSTMQLAKKQRTWFRRNKSIQWFSTPVSYTSIVDFVTTHLNK